MFAGVSIALYGLSLMAGHFVEEREEFWIKRLGNIKIQRPGSLIGKLKKLFNYSSKKLVSEYEKTKTNHCTSMAAFPGIACFAFCSADFSAGIISILH